MTLRKPTIAAARKLYESGNIEEALQLLDEIGLRMNVIGKNARWTKKFLLAKHPYLAGSLKYQALAETRPVAVIVHLFHKDSFADLAERLKPLDPIAAFFATGPYASSDPDVCKFGESFEEFTYIQVDNRGRDVRPFIKVFDRISEYSLCLKVHTKKGKLALGDLWRKVLFDSCFGSIELCNHVIELFRSDPEVALVGSYDMFKSGRHHLTTNAENMHKLLSQSDIGDQEFPQDWGFIAGTIFWFRPSAFKDLLSIDYDDYFGIEKGSLDGEIEHAFERLFGLVPFLLNLKMRLIKVDWPKSCYEIVSPNYHRLSFLPPSASLEEINRKFKDSLSLTGSIDSMSGTSLTGWCASRASDMPRYARISIDHNYEIVTKADLFRPDLEVHKICQGKASFIISVPSNFFDGEQHVFTLYDHESDIRVAEKKIRLRKATRPFTDLHHFFKYSYTSPEVRAPFVESDYRVLSSLDGLRRKLLAEYDETSKRISFSVIMPVYNRENYVKEAIDSVIAQAHSNLELIIVDDGSTDNTFHVASSVVDPRIRVIRYDCNMGVSHARNQGLLAAKHEYIAYLDSDNTWHDEHLACVASALTANAKPDCFYTGQLLFLGHERKIYGYRFGILNRSLCANSSYIDLNCFGHKNYVLNGRSEPPLFDSQLKRFVDWEYIVRMVSFRRTMSIPIMTSFYNVLRCADSITGADDLLPLLSEVRSRNTRVIQASDAEHCATKKLSKSLTIVIPSYGATAELKRCVDCIESSYLPSLDAGSVFVVIVDNGSSPQDLVDIARIASKSWISLVRLDRNYGFTYAANHGIHLASPSHDIVLLNNDAYLSPGSLEELQSNCYQEPGIGITVPAQVLPPHAESINSHVPFADNASEVDVAISAHHDNIDLIDPYSLSSTVDLLFAPFFCVYIPRRTIDEVGMLDHLLGRHYRSDRIYCAQLRSIYQKRIVFCPKARVCHDVQKSTSHLQKHAAPSEFNKIFLHNTWDNNELADMGEVLPAWMPTLSEEM